MPLYTLTDKVFRFLQSNLAASKVEEMQEMATLDFLFSNP